MIARPTGIYGPGDRRLLKLFRGVARRRFVILGAGRIFYHLTYIDDLVEGFRLCGEVPAAAGRTYILAGGEVTTLNELVALDRRGGRRAAADAAPAGVAVLGRGRRSAKRSARRSASSRRSTAAASISSRRAARSTSPARAPSSATRHESTLREGIRRTLEWYRREKWI